MEKLWIGIASSLLAGVPTSPTRGIFGLAKVRDQGKGGLFMLAAARATVAI